MIREYDVDNFNELSRHHANNLGTSFESSDVNKGKTLPYVYKVDVKGVVFVPNFALGKGLILFLYKGRVQIENC